MNLRTPLRAAATLLVLAAMPLGATAGTWFQDQDADGWGDPLVSIVASSPPFGYVANALDCDDTNPAIRPGAPEPCGGGIDRNCDGWMDSGCLAWFPDVDGDGWGSNGNVFQGASPPPGYVGTGLDCHDADPALNPGAVEVCGDSFDNNCDSYIDNTCSPVASEGASWGRLKGSYR